MLGAQSSSASQSTAGIWFLGEAIRGNTQLVGSCLLSHVCGVTASPQAAWKH